MKKLTWVGIILIFGLSRNLPADDLSSETKAIERAHETVSIARKNFKKALQDAISEKGAQGALGECKLMAPSMGLKNDQIEVGRTSHKLRNQMNKPREWLKPILQEYLKTPVEKQARHKLVPLGPGHYGYIEPIYVEAICLNCHGANLKPEVRKEITNLYPSDQATDFKVGDFRGLIWLESRSH